MSERKFQKFGIDNINAIISHERVTFRINKSEILTQKFSTYLSVLDEIFEKFTDNVSVVQEFGGFLSVISTFLIARHYGYNNWFIEPSFFRGKLFYNLNTFDAARISEFPDSHRDMVMNYLEATLSTQEIVIPKKIGINIIMQ